MIEQEQWDRHNARESWRNYWIHELMNYYRMPYEMAEREIDQYGLSKMVYAMTHERRAVDTNSQTSYNSPVCKNITLK